MTPPVNIIVGADVMAKITLGPLLRLAHATPRVWTISVLVLADESPGTLTTNGGNSSVSAEPVAIPTVRGHSAWRYLFEVVLGTDQQTLRYSVPGCFEGRFTLPAAGHLPRMVYTSCNGVSDPRLAHDVSALDALWHVLMGRHEQTLGPDPDQPAPYHLLLMGGDQIYADPLFQSAPFSDWQNLFNVGKYKAAFTARMRDVAERYYHDRYVEVFGMSMTARAMASIPTIAMWDDHDIFDGWGSYDDARQNCPVYQGIYPIARRFFRLFQLHLGEDDPLEASVFPPAAHTNFSCAYDFGALALAVPDLRSERTIGQVMKPASWDALLRWMEQPRDQLRHLFFMSSIPMVYADASALEKILSDIPFHQGAEDDLRDQWTNHRHAGERDRVIRRLLDLASRVRVSVLSGDVHVGARGAIESRRTKGAWAQRVINQLISSAIAHPPPGMLQNRVVETVTADPVEAGGVISRLETFTLPDGSRRRIIAARNFLSLEPDDDPANGRYWCNWYVESAQGLLPAAGTPHAERFPRHDKLTYVVGPPG
jgi:hypothetical protein